MAGTTNRICPNCDKVTGEKFCPKCQLPTILNVVAEDAGDPYIGKAFQDGRYKITKLIGRGGMGSVYKAIQQSIHREVAVKILNPEYTKNIEMVKRFHREALAASRLTHPHIVEIHDFGETDEGDCFIVMEYLQGQELSDILRSCRGLPIERVVKIGTQIAKALMEAHKHNVVHRDLKPENILIKQVEGEGDFVKILDFGIAKFLDDKADTPEDQKRDMGLTKTGMVMGSPHYMSPEQGLGKLVDRKGDIYSFGIILYEMIAGVVPFDSESALGILMRHVKEFVTPLHVLREDVPPTLESLVYKMIEKNKRDRLGSLEELIEQLKRVEAELIMGQDIASYEGRRPMPSQKPLAIKGPGAKYIDKMAKRPAAVPPPTPSQAMDMAATQADVIPPPRPITNEQALHKAMSSITIIEEPTSSQLMLRQTRMSQRYTMSKETKSKGRARWFIQGAALVVLVVTTVLVTRLYLTDPPPPAPAYTSSLGAAQMATPLHGSTGIKSYEELSAIPTTTPGVDNATGTSSEAPLLTTHTLTITTVPPGAMVAQGDVPLGTTPFIKEYPQGTDLDLTVTLDGFKSSAFDVVMDEDRTLHAELAQLTELPKVKAPVKSSKTTKKTTKTSAPKGTKTTKKTTTSGTKATTDKKSTKKKIEDLNVELLD